MPAKPASQDELTLDHDWHQQQATACMMLSGYFVQWSSKRRNDVRVSFNAGIVEYSGSAAVWSIVYCRQRQTRFLDV